MSMDGLFGLPQNKSAGSSFRDAIHVHLFFGEQAAVDEYVASAFVKHVNEPKVCTIMYSDLCKVQGLKFVITYCRCAVVSLLEML